MIRIEAAIAKAKECQEAYIFMVSKANELLEYVDQNMDISMLVDPMVQSYIFENNLYLRAQQYKAPLQAREFRLDFGREEDGYVTRLIGVADGKPFARAEGRTVRSDSFYGLTGSAQAADFLRARTSGRVLLVTAVQAQQPEGLSNYFYAGYHVRANGNCVVANWTGHSGRDFRPGWKLIEFAPDGKVVWNWNAPWAGTPNAVIVFD